MPNQKIIAYTLVDITENGMVHIRDANTKQYHQNQNLHVLLQIIGLRAQPFDIQVEVIKNADLSKYKFSDVGVNTATVWALYFTIEHELPWANVDGSLGELYNDANNVAITSDLDNTVEFDTNVFDTKSTVNLYFCTGI